MSLQNLILGMLTYTPMTGYDLKTSMDNSLSFFWTAHLSQIYRELTGIEAKGYASSQIEPQEGRPDRKIYKATREGRTAFRKWLEQFPTPLSPSIRDEFMVRIFFGALLPPGEIAFQLRRYLKEQETALAGLDAVEQFAADMARPDVYPMQPVYWNMLIRRHRMLTETLIEWTQECLRELEAL